MPASRTNISHTNISRRSLLVATATAGASLTRPALADASPVRIGFLPALTGASSSTGIAMGRGVEFAVKELNASGGVGGRPVELIIRDTASDPTKAVNAGVELARGQGAHVIFGPGNSGESLAVTPVIARANVPQIDPCWVNSLIDVTKYPLAFRNAPSNQQIGAASIKFVVDVMGIRDVALVGDTTGYGTASVQAYSPMLKAKGANIVYENVIELSQPDLLPEMTRMRDAGAKVIMPWSVNAGLLARMLNTRAHMGWDVPVAGQTTLGSGQTKALLEKPENWERVYQINFASASYGADGKLPPRTEEFVAKLKAAGVDASDTLLWWIACGYDAVMLSNAAVKNAGTDPKAMAAYWELVKAFPGVYGDYTWTKDNHNGYPDVSVVMSQANSFRNGTFKLAPGYA